MPTAQACCFLSRPDIEHRSQLGSLLPLVPFQRNMLGCSAEFLTPPVELRWWHRSLGRCWGHEPPEGPVCDYSAFQNNRSEGAKGLPSGIASVPLHLRSLEKIQRESKAGTTPSVPHALYSPWWLFSCSFSCYSIIYAACVKNHGSP